METEKLIAALARDAGPPPRSLARIELLATGTAALIVLCAFVLFIGPRDDIWSALQSPRFVLKPLLTLTFFIATLYALAAAMRPDARLGPGLLALSLPLVGLSLAVIGELVVVPPELWVQRVTGTNAVYCLLTIVALAFAPLGAFLWALRQGAPTNPTRAGAIAGLAAAGLGATFYALNCTNDSPLFVAVWYPLASVLVAAAGAFLGRRWLRW